MAEVTFNRGDCAKGVDFTWNSRFWPETDSEVHSVRATRLVLLSSGAFGSPGILERSGIGQEKVLQQTDVAMKINLPGVGNDYQGQKLAPYLWSCS